MLAPAFDRQQNKRETRQERRTFASAHRAEAQYARQLRGVAHYCGGIASFYREDDPASANWVIAALRRYSDTLGHWARATSERMLADVARRDEASWARHGRSMGLALRKEITRAPTGELLRRLLDEQVTLISSLPLDAAHRVHEWTIKGLEGSERPDAVSKAIYATGHVTKGRANLIARTEVARTASKLVEARARYVGSEQYLWTSAGDSDVRSEHRKLNGKVFFWDDPPVAGTNGMRYHAGQGPNCRCVPLPLIPDDIGT